MGSGSCLGVGGISALLQGEVGRAREGGGDADRSLLLGLVIEDRRRRDRRRVMRLGPLRGRGFGGLKM